MSTTTTGSDHTSDRSGDVENGAAALRRPAWAAATLAIDEILFRPGGWFVIDASNRAVPGIVVASLEHGLDIVDAARDSGHRPATVVGRLVDAARAVDIDVPGAHGYLLLDQLTGWATARGIWHLTRPSGGATGRSHLYLYAAPDQLDHLVDELPAFIEDLRTEHGLPAKALEARTAIRPLTAPHRNGRTTKPEGPLVQRLRHLEQIAVRLTAPAGGRDAKTSKSSPGAGAGESRADGVATDPTAAPRRRTRRASVTALMPLERRRRDLPPIWRAYLAHGVRPRIGGGDQSASAVDLVATAELLRAGYGLDDAWDTIEAAHPDAMTHARRRGRAWWIKFHWNAAAATDTTWREHTDDPSATSGATRGGLEAERQHQTTARPGASQPNQPSYVGRASEPSPQVLHAVEAARRSLTDLQWAWGPRQRHSTLLVAHTLLDRMARTGQLQVPCPQRDLHVDTGLSRPTIAAALALLGHRTDPAGPTGPTDRDDGDHRAGRAGHGATLRLGPASQHDPGPRCLGALLTTFDPTRRDTSSHEFALAPRYRQPGFSRNDFEDRHGVSVPLPPASHTPHRSGLWHHLPPAAHSLWRALPPPTGASADLQEAAHRAGLTTERSAQLTPRQERTVRTHAASLITAGLAQVLPDGTYRRLDPHALTDIATDTGALRAQAAEKRARAEERVAIERAAYRTGSGTSWRRAHTAAVARERAAARARYERWCTHHTPEQRRERSQHHAAAYAGHSLDDQRRLKERWAQHRHHLGIDERTRHDTWCLELGPHDYAQRSAERAAAFAALSGPEKAAAVMAWSDHRTRWNVPQGWPDPARSTTARHPVDAVSNTATRQRAHDGQHSAEALPGMENLAG